MNLFKSTSLLLLSAFMIQWGVHSSMAQTTVTRNATSRKNVARGFGFYPTLGFHDMTTRSGVVKALFEDMQPDLIRISFEPDFSDGAGNIDTADASFKRRAALVKTAASKGISKWIGVHWSPPHEFRRYATSNCKDSSGNINHLLTDKEDDYARYIVKLVNAFVAQGCPPPYGISIQNELTFCPSSWSGCLIEPPQFQRLVKLFRSELDAAGYGKSGTKYVRVMGPESGSISGSVDHLGGNGFPNMSADATFAAALTELISHYYHPNQWSGGVYCDNWKNSTSQWSSGRDIWQTEISKIDGDGTELYVALQMTREIGKHFAYIEGNWWVFWGGWRPDQFEERYPREFLAMGNVTTTLPTRSKWYHSYRLIMNNTEANSKVYNMSTSDTGLRDVGTDGNERWVDLFAFQGASRSCVVLVNATTSGKSIALKGLTSMGTSASVYRVSSSESGTLLYTRAIDGSGNVSGTLDLSANSILVVATNGGSGTTSNPVPTVSLTSPANGATFNAPASIALSASASDNGSVSKVEFFNGSSLLSADTSSPYATTWSSVAAGAYTLTAKATDNAGAATTSSEVNVTVNGSSTTSSGGATVTLNPTQDAYVRDGTSASSNYGSSTVLESKTSTTSGLTRRTFLMFDISSVASVTSAKLRLYGKYNDTAGGTSSIQCYNATDDSWTESGVTWNNQPVAGSLLSSTTVTTTIQYYEWDVTSFVKSEKAGGFTRVSLVIKNDSATTSHVSFNSREAASNKPQLVVTP